LKCDVPRREPGKASLSLAVYWLNCLPCLQINVFTSPLVEFFLPHRPLLANRRFRSQAHQISSSCDTLRSCLGDLHRLSPCRHFVVSNSAQVIFNAFASAAMLSIETFLSPRSTEPTYVR
jgi:hypothetical protein